MTLASGADPTLASGDKVAIRIVGSVITALHFTTAAGWTQVLELRHRLGQRSATPPQAASRSSSRPARLDDFGGGSLAAASPPPANITLPSISGDNDGRPAADDDRPAAGPGSRPRRSATSGSAATHKAPTAARSAATAPTTPSSPATPARRSSSPSPPPTPPATPPPTPPSSARSAPPSSPPVNITPRRSPGTTTVGQQLTTTTGSWSGQPAPTFSYQWKRCDTQGANCSPVGSNSPNYTLVAGDAGSTILVTVTANNTAGQANADAAFVGPVGTATSPPVNITPRRSPGTTTVGQQLTTTTGSWSGQPAPTFSYQWKRCDTQGANCSPVGSNSPNYTLVAGDAGSTILVTVTANNTAGQASADSAFVGPVGTASSPPANITPRRSPAQRRSASS